jgi:hypothetical protein
MTMKLLTSNLLKHLAWYLTDLGYGKPPKVVVIEKLFVEVLAIVLHEGELMVLV